MVKAGVKWMFLFFVSCLGQLSSGLYPPQCHWSLVDDLDRLNCRVESRSSLIVEEAVHGMGPEHAKSLWVNCESDNAVGEVRPGLNGFDLSHGVFMAVPHLRDLRLEGCRIAGITPGALGYLPNLQNMSIHARTSHSRPLFPLEVKAGVLRGLPLLQSLDLSTTSLTSLPNDFLCFLPALKHLNFSACSLREFRSIGILPNDPTNPTNNCGKGLRTLDLSLNQFTLLPPATFVALNRLQELRLDSNSITLAAERALLGLTELRVLSLAGNQLTSLPPEFFKDNRLLTQIHLHNNSLDVLAPGLFADLEQLTLLDLSVNELSSDWVTGDTFRGLIRLNVLNLAQNRISRLSTVMFNDLSSLQILSLDNNRISQMSDTVFSGMPHLHTLILSHNELKVLDGRICTGLPVLSYLALDNNKMASVEMNTFQNCSSVEDLNLSGNKLQNVPEAIGALVLLKTLDLGENLIRQINGTSFERLPNLYGLRLTGNKIEAVAKDAFAQLPSLKIVNLAENNLTTLEAGTFDDNTNLHAVRLDVNRIQNISGLFRNVPNLLWLNISGNELVELDYAEFPSRLQLLNVQWNKIQSLASCLHIDNLRIRTLDLSDNALTEIGSANLPDSVQKLILKNNQIHAIQPYTFFRKPNLTLVDLTSNQLVTVDRNSLRLSPPGNRAPVEILLGNNPFLCDCSMQWLQGSSHSAQYPLLIDSAEVKCSLTFAKSPVLVELMQVPATEFLCRYERECSGACNCCDYDACDCQLTCPTNCTCFHDDAWTVNRVDCSMHDIAFVPNRIPMDVTELHLDGNALPNIEAHAFIGRKKLRSLYLNGSHVETIQNRSFAGLKQLRTLHLENNFIERLEGFEFAEIVNVEELYLHENSISWISNSTFARLVKLSVLWLHGNNLVDLPIWEVTTEVGKLGSRLSQLTLRGNEWSCECGFVTQFKEWLMDYRAVVRDASQVQCVDQVYNNNRAGQKRELLVVRLVSDPNHRCSASPDTSVVEQPIQAEVGLRDWSEYIPLIFSLSAICVLLLFAAFLLFRCRAALRVWLHAKFGLRLTSCSEPVAERDKLFDAFVSYSSKDDAWVREVVAGELERQDPPFRLCLRYRDLPSGGAYLADTIVQAAEASRRTVLVLSHHFLKDEWSRSDVKSAHHSVLKDRGRRVVIILLGELPSKDLDPDIRLYLKNHTWLSAEDERFWQKLRYALPDVAMKMGRLGGHAQRSSPVAQSHYPPPSKAEPLPPQYQQYAPTQSALVLSMPCGRTETVLSPALHPPPLPPFRLPPSHVLPTPTQNRHTAIHI